MVILGGKTPDIGSRTYTEIMKEQYLRAEETEVSKKGNQYISIKDLLLLENFQSKILITHFNHFR